MATPTIPLGCSLTNYVARCIIKAYANVSRGWDMWQSYLSSVKQLFCQLGQIASTWAEQAVENVPNFNPSCSNRIVESHNNKSVRIGIEENKFDHTPPGPWFCSR